LDPSAQGNDPDFLHDHWAGKLNLKNNNHWI
jgi:hypothetical protein